MMEQRRLGRTDLKVSAIGLGCSRLGSVTQTGGSQAALRLIGSALDAGINFFDTADIYGQGASESLLGKAIKNHRDKVVIATKAGYCLSTLGSIAKRIKPLLRRFIRLKPSLTQSIQRVRAAQNQQNFSTEYLARRIDVSLRRLRTEALDLFQLHSPPTAVLQRGEVFEALEKFKAQGKIRFYGVSCLTADDALLCLKQPGIAAVQLQLNLLSPQAIDQVVSPSQANGIGVIARQSLAGGLLLRSAAELRPEDSASRNENFEELKARLEQFEGLAAEAGGSLPQLALQFLLQLDGVSNVLIGTTSSSHLQEHLAVLARPPLAPDNLARIHSVLRSPGRSSK